MLSYGVDGAWRLSPVYDVVPNLGDKPMVMRVGSAFRPDISDALAHSGQFGISRGVADAIVGEVAAAVGRWREWMARRGVSMADIERIAPAFGRSSLYGPVVEDGPI
jgi:serine/threonine-protein kinase HipA